MELSNAVHALPQPTKQEFNFQPTLLNSAGLFCRLSIEVTFLLTTLKNGWPAFRQDPLGSTKRTVAELRQSLAPDQRMLAAVTVALVIVASGGLVIVIRDSTHRKGYVAVIDPVDAAIEILNLPPDVVTHSGNGVGTGSLGRVGFDRRRGEGSHPEPRRSQGGGSGGNRQKRPVSNGSIPLPSEIPAPIPTAEFRKNPTLPAAGIDLDPVLWKALPAPVYGDPRSSATTPSNGSGEGGGIGSHYGQGIGEGRGNGFGRGWNGNMGDGEKELGGGKRGGANGGDPNGSESVLRASMVSERARVLSKPEPQYTEEARRNQISGTVVLRAVFSKTGEVTNIRAIASLPFGLTERAIAAARQIRFRPATKDNHPVSVHMQLEYNFNLY